VVERANELIINLQSVVSQLLAGIFEGDSQPKIFQNRWQQLVGDAAGLLNGFHN